MPADRDSGLRVGILGAGYISDFHATALRATPGAELVAVADLSEERAAALAQRHGVESVHTSLESMLEQSAPDVVHILLPPDLHTETALQVLESGAHVLLEKPMCHTVEDCRRVCAKADAVERTVGVSHNFLFFPAYEQLRLDLKAGRLGRIDEIEIVWHKFLPQARFGPFGAWMLKHPRNIMFEVAPHSFAHVLDLVDEAEVLDVDASNPLELEGGGRFYQRWWVRAKSGSTHLAVRFSFVDGYPEHRVRLRGSVASATCDFERNLYQRHHHRPLGMDFDRYATITSEAANAIKQATQTLTQYALTKAKLSKQGAPFQASITRAVGRFYDDLAHPPLDRRLDAGFGAQVVDFAQRVADASDIEVPAAKRVRPNGKDKTPRSTVLVTGGTGFIGRAVVRALRREGYGVRVLSRGRSLPPDLADQNIELCTGRLTDADTIERALQGIEHVIHLARSHGTSWEEFERGDVQTTRALAEAAQRHGVERFVYASSIVIYDAGDPDAVISDDTPPDRHVTASQAYAKSKVACEQLLQQMYAETGFGVVIVRPGIVLGSGGNPCHWGVGMWLYPSVCEVWGEGDKPLPLVLVDDVADGFVRCLQAEGIEGEAFNLVDDPIMTANEYLDALERSAGIRIERHTTPIWQFYATDMFKWMVKMAVRHPERTRPSLRAWRARTAAARFDCTKAKERLGWKPAGDRRAIVQQGIEVPVREFMA